MDGVLPPDGHGTGPEGVRHPGAGGFPQKDQWEPLFTGKGAHVFDFFHVGGGAGGAQDREVVGNGSGQASLYPAKTDDFTVGGSFCGGFWTFRMGEKTDFLESVPIKKIGDAFTHIQFACCPTGIQLRFAAHPELVFFLGLEKGHFVFMIHSDAYCLN